MLEEIQINNLEKLEKYNEAILAGINNSRKEIWWTGKNLLDVKNQKLYLEKYPTWTAYIAETFYLSERSAQRYMQIADNFTPEQVEQWGPSKLGFTLTLEGPKREEFLSTHSPRESVTEVKEQVQKFNWSARLKEEYPAQNPNNEFFAITEMKLQQLLGLIQETQDHLTSCSMNPEYVTYPRRAIMLQVWGMCQNEMQRENQNI